MPAPPYASGTEMPSRPSDAIPAKNDESKRCSRSRSWILGATSRAAHSRTDCSRRCCSSVRSKSIMRRQMLSRVTADAHCRTRPTAIMRPSLPHALGATGRSSAAPGGLSKEDFAQVVLQEKRVRHAQRREQPDDVAVEQNRLAAARGRIRPVLQVRRRPRRCTSCRTHRAAAPCRRSRAARLRAAARAPTVRSARAPSGDRGSR